LCERSEPQSEPFVGQALSDSERQKIESISMNYVMRKNIFPADQGLCFELFE
jgi:hypothetical protein